MKQEIRSIQDLNLTKKILKSKDFELFKFPAFPPKQPVLWETIIKGDVAVSLEDKFVKVGSFNLDTPFKTHHNQPLHQVLKKRIFPHFNVFESEEIKVELSNFIQERFKEKLDLPSINVMDELAMPVVVYGMIKAFGVEEKDFSSLLSYSLSLKSIAATPGFKYFKPNVVNAAIALNKCLGSIYLERKNLKPGIIRSLVELEEEGEITREQGLTLLITLFIGGFETTPVMICNGINLLNNNKHWVNDFKGGNGDYETLFWEIARVKSPVVFLARKCLKDLKIDDVQFNKGEILHLQIDRMHLTSGELELEEGKLTNKPNRNLVFGAGRHLCVAHIQARIEIELLLEAYVQNFDLWNFSKTGAGVNNFMLLKR